MAQQRFYSDSDLAELAREWRERSGNTKAAVARELGVTRPTMQDVEDRPEKSLAKLRCRIIEKYSPYKVAGPFYVLEQK